MFCRKQESKRSMSKEKAAELMQDFFASRRAERAEEQGLLVDHLDDMREGVDDLGKKEFMSGSVLDSVNFLKQDEAAPPPKTRSGTVTKAMLAQLTTPDKAELYEKKAEAAAKILGGLVHGAFATMTGEAAAGNVVETARSMTPGRQRPSASADAERSSNAPASSRPKSARRSREAGGADAGIESLEREKQELMAKVMALEEENRRLKHSSSQTNKTPASAASSTSMSSFFTPPSASALFGSWAPTNTPAKDSPSASASSGYVPKGARGGGGNKPEWL